MRSLKRCQAGLVTLEFATIAPVMALLLIGASDVGMLAARSATLEAAARAGAEYARVASAPTAMAAIESKVTGYTSFSPAVTATATRFCECDDGQNASGVAAQGYCFDNATNAATCPGGTPVHVYVSVTATQNFTPLVPLGGVVFPSTLSATVTMRVQ